ncbi:MAG: GyrI-like domain-containing protein [Ktedonobacteraceae bacterium]|nr:GyrI-like domain-containing protein [Ktedonobacteraceae bacterium]
MSRDIEPTRLDLKADLKPFYSPPAQEVVIADIPAMNFLMLDGKGDPNTAQEYKDAIEAIYTIAYTTKFLLKKEAAIDYPVMPLEGLWWADGGREAPRENWQWTMMIMQPNCVTDEWFAEAYRQAQRKKKLRALEKVRLERFHEGKVAQIMHIGPFADEGPTIEKLGRFLEEHGYAFRGKHHEIYLSDLRRTAPDKMHTVLRHPFA